MTGHRIAARMLIYAMLATTFALGLPLFHYVTAMMIVLVIRHGQGEDGLTAPIRFPATRQPAVSRLN